MKSSISCVRQIQFKFPINQLVTIFSLAMSDHQQFIENGIDPNIISRTRQQEDDTLMNGNKSLCENILSQESQCKRIDVTFRDCLPQILATCVINLTVIQAGINMTFSSILIPQLSGSESDIKIDIDSASTIASIVTISIAIGEILPGS